VVSQPTPRPNPNQQAQQRRRRAAERQERLKRQRYARFNKSSWRITDVVDGDTVKVRKLSGPAPRTDWTVRVIGIDTPETVKPDTPVECAGPNATASMLTLGFSAPVDANLDGLVDTKGGDGRQVYLRTDITQDLYDSFGRLLAYVVTLPGTDLGLRQIEQGGAALTCSTSCTPATRSTAMRRRAPGTRVSACGAPAAATSTWRRSGLRLSGRDGPLRAPRRGRSRRVAIAARHET
jgi:micrococcal nuclease